MAATTRHQNYQTGMGATFFYSLFVHALIILIGIVGLPHFKREFEQPQPISVEIAMIDEVIKTKKPPIEEPKPEPKKEEKPVKAPPRALEQPKKETSKPKQKKEEKIEKPVKKETPPPPKESILKKPEIKKPKPEPKKEKEVKKEEKKDEFENMMTSVLKNLAPEEEQSKPDTSQQGEVAQVITADELSAVRQQLTNCWNLLPGARDADKLAVELRIQVYRDRTVQNVEIVDKGRYATDPFFRAAAENAIRAVRNPACNPLNLPPNKYDLWKDIIFNFDPQGMF